MELASRMYSRVLDDSLIHDRLLTMTMTVYMFAARQEYF